MLHEDYKELLQLLDQNSVKYLLVGGYAVMMYGYARYTGDIDIWYLNEKENINKVLKTLEEFGFASLGLEYEDLSNPGSIIQLGFEPLRIDLLNQIDGVLFESCYENRKIEFRENIKIHLINLEDLKTNKRASGRYKDLNDLENL